MKIQTSDLLDALDQAGFEVGLLRKASGPEDVLQLMRSLVQPGMEVDRRDSQFGPVFYITDETGKKTLASFRQQDNRMEAAVGDVAGAPNLCKVYRKIPLGNKAEVTGLISRTLIEANVLNIPRKAMAPAA